MGTRLLPRSLPELYSHAIALEREATKRFETLARCMREAGLDHLAEEFAAIGKEEREQYELLAVGTAGQGLPEIAPWEYAWHYMGEAGDQVPVPQTVRHVLALAVSAERRTMNFYADVAEHVEDDAVSALAAEMAADESRHVERLERLLAREPVSAATGEDTDSVPIR